MEHMVGGLSGVIWQRKNVGKKFFFFCHKHSFLLFFFLFYFLFIIMGEMSHVLFLFVIMPHHWQVYDTHSLLLVDCHKMFNRYFLKLNEGVQLEQIQNKMSKWIMRTTSRGRIWYKPKIYNILNKNITYINIAPAQSGYPFKSLTWHYRF